MRQMYSSLACPSLDKGEFVPTQWLINWLNSDEKLGPIDNSPLLCEHRKLNPEKFRDYKIISTNAVNIFYRCRYKNIQLITSFFFKFVFRLMNYTTNITVALGWTAIIYVGIASRQNALRTAFVRNWKQIAN